MNKNDLSVAVMQPYIFPYIGYFQLINLVDTFVFYDDVNFIKQGWINRNRIIGSNMITSFTIPLSKASSFKTIHETEINRPLFKKWEKKFLKTLEQTYSKTPYFNPVYSLVKHTLESEIQSISGLAIKSIEYVCQYLDLNIDYKLSSKEFNTSVELDRTARLFSICKNLGATYYINSIGGSALYKKDEFWKEGINLLFLEEQITPYVQFDNEFIPRLSIIDVMMFNSKSDIQAMLNNYKLV